MQRLIKVVIVGDFKIFNVELVFNLLQRKVFADCMLNVYIVTLEVEEVMEMTVHVEKCAFCNMNELIVTRDIREAFLDADYLIMMSDLNVQHIGIEDMVNFKYFIDKARLFDRLANPNARVLMMGPQCYTWLQIFAEIASNLSKENFTGLSRHYVNKAVTLITQKLSCDAQDVTGVYVWGPDYLDFVHAKKRSKLGPGKDSLQCKLKTQSVVELLPLNWIDNYLIPETLNLKTGRHSIISAVCNHLHDWYKGTGDRIVCMVTIVQKPGDIADGLYSSYPVIIDENGVVTIIKDIDMESSLYVKLYNFHDKQQREKIRIRNFIEHNELNSNK